jgi:hypothetical protein
MVNGSEIAYGIFNRSFELMNADGKEIAGRERSAGTPQPKPTESWQDRIINT